MSDPAEPVHPAPETPVASPPARLSAAARVAARTPITRPKDPAELPQLPTLLMFFGAFVVAVHILFGRTDFDIGNRAFAVVPILPVLWETNRFHKLPRGTQMPFGIYATFFYYVTFSFPALFNTKFLDLSGPVVFSDAVRFEGTAAVAVSSLMIYAGIRLGEILGRKLQPSLLRIYPPKDIPTSYPRAIIWYALGCAAWTQAVSLGAHLPAAIAVVATMVFSFSFVIGAVIFKPESFRGPWSRYLIPGVLAFGTLSGLLRGVIEPLFRLTLAAIMVRWVYLRRFSVGLVVVMVAVYVIFQPAKAKFRQQTWTVRGSEQVAGYEGRVDAWALAFDDLWSSRDAGESTGESAVSRFLELDPVLHAFTLMPGRVHSAEGAAWKNIVYAPIPRFLWPDKPNSNDLDLSYGVTFNRQNEVGAQSTSIMLPLVVDGYWNYGWPGIVFVSIMTGLWVGLCQSIFAGDHWALKASAVALFSLITVTGSFALAYSGVTQQIIGVTLASWIVYWLACFLNSKDHSARLRGITRRPLAAPGPVLARRVTRP